MSQCILQVLPPAFGSMIPVSVAGEARFGLWSLLLPTGIALLAVALGLLDDFERGERR